MDVGEERREIKGKRETDKQTEGEREREQKYMHHMTMLSCDLDILLQDNF